MLQQLLSEYWQILFPHDAKPSTIHLMKIGGGRTVYSPVSFFLFREADGFPSYHLLVSRDTRSSSMIRRAYQEYSLIYRRINELRSSVPRPIACEDVVGFTVLVESFIPGRPPRLGNRRKTESFLSQSLEWLIKFDQETMAARFIINKQFIETHLDHPINVLQQEVPEVQKNLEPRLQRLREDLILFEGAQIPIVAVHGMFNSVNILIDRGNLAVVNWQHCKAIGLPFDDFLSLFFQIATDLRPGQAAYVTQSFLMPDDQSWLGEIFRYSLSRFAIALGISAELTHLLIRVSLFEKWARNHQSFLLHRG